MSEIIETVAKAIQYAAQEDWDLQIPTDEGALVLARAAIEATAETIEKRYGEGHPGAIYIRSELRHSRPQSS